MASGTVRSYPVRLVLCAIGALVCLVALAPAVRAATPDTCSNSTLVLDESGSVDPYETTVRSAVHAFLNPLVGSGVSTSVIEFGTSATTVFGYTPINASNVSNLFDPYVDATSAGNVYNPPSQLGAYTNWDDALDEVSALNATGPVAPTVLFVTDGDPTAYNLDQSGEPGGVHIDGVSAEAVDRAVEEADQVKAQGSHIIAIGVGAALSNSASIERLKMVSGPDVYNGTGGFDLDTTDVVLVPDFADLPAAMALIAQAMCADPGIDVEKTVSQSAVTAGSEVTYEITVTNTGNVPLHDVVLDDPLITSCSEDIGDLAVGASVTVTCSLTVWGPVTNVATASGTDPFGTPVSDDGSAQVTLIASGTGTPGFWKNHPGAWPIIGDQIIIGDWNHNWSCDPDETCLALTREEAMSALGTPPKGDMTWNLARPLVAAWLNVSSGNESSCIAETIDLATAWLLDHPVGSGVGGGDDAWHEASGWAGILDDYNNGRLCAEHRDSKEATSEIEESSGTKVTTGTTQPTTVSAPPKAPAAVQHGQEPPSKTGKGHGNGNGPGKGNH